MNHLRIKTKKFVNGRTTAHQTNSTRVCFDCQHAERSYGCGDYICPHCQKPMVRMHSKWRVPAKGRDKAWVALFRCLEAAKQPPAWLRAINRARRGRPAGTPGRGFAGERRLLQEAKAKLTTVAKSFLVS